MPRLADLGARARRVASSLLLMLLAASCAACVPLARPPGVAPRPGWVIADPGAPAPRHHQRLRSLGTEEARVEEWILADGRPWEGRLLSLDRRGRLLRSERLPAQTPPSPLAVETPAPSWPSPVGRHELRQSRVGEHLRITFAERGDDREAIVASLVASEGLELRALRLGPGRHPTIAALAWRAGEGVEGVEILDLRRARASLWLRRGLEHHDHERYHQAREYFRHARDLDPEFPEALYDLACTEALLGDGDAAMALLAEALRRSPDRLRGVAEEDEDLVSLRERPDWLPLLRGDR